MLSENFVTFCNMLAVSSELVSAIQIMFSVTWFVAKQDQNRYHDIAVFCLASAIHTFIQLAHYIIQSYRHRSFRMMDYSIGIVTEVVMIMLHTVPIVWGGAVFADTTENPIPLFSYIWPWIHVAICIFVWEFARKRVQELTDDHYVRV
jgi:hypothetical protein